MKRLILIFGQHFMRRYITVLLSLFTLLFLSCSESGRKKGADKSTHDGFQQVSRQFKSFPKHFIREIESFFPPGFSGTALLYRDGFLYRMAMGKSDAAGKQKMHQDDIFQLASVSKPVTAVAVMQLVSAGKVALDTWAGKYISGFPYPGVTVRQLLCHRSGLPNYLYYTDTLKKDETRLMNNEDFRNFMKKGSPKPYTEPGAGFSYCNTNFAYLAVLVSECSGMPFHRYAEERIFKPAGMENSYFTGFKPERIQRKELTGRYDRHEYTELYPVDGIHGDKSLLSTAGDLFLFHLALSEGKLLPLNWLDSMQVPTFGPNVYGGSYGLGFRLMKTPSGQWAYHNGWWRGFWTSFWNRFDKKVCMVILTNNKRSSHVDKQGLAEFLLKGW